MCERDMTDVVGPLQWRPQGCSTLHLSKHAQCTCCIQQILLLSQHTTLSVRPAHYYFITFVRAVISDNHSRVIKRNFLSFIRMFYFCCPMQCMRGNCVMCNQPSSNWHNINNVKHSYLLLTTWIWQSWWPRPAPMSAQDQKITIQKH